MHTEKTLARHDLYDGKVLKMHVDDVELENGAAATREAVDHPGGVCIGAMTDAGEILMVRQYRYPYKEEVTEIPAGKLDPGEDPAEAAKRELREETGCTGKDWQFLGNIYPSPGYTNELLRMYTCRVDGALKEQDLDEDEFVDVEKMPLSTALKLVNEGRLPDAKTQILVLRLAGQN